MHEYNDMTYISIIYKENEELRVKWQRVERSKEQILVEPGRHQLLEIRNSQSFRAMCKGVLLLRYGLGQHNI